jgi:hypothetical protein
MTIHYFTWIAGLNSAYFISDSVEKLLIIFGINEICPTKLILLKYSRAKSRVNWLKNTDVSETMKSDAVDEDRDYP